MYVVYFHCYFLFQSFQQRFAFQSKVSSVHVCNAKRCSSQMLYYDNLEDKGKCSSRASKGEYDRVRQSTVEYGGVRGSTGEYGGVRGSTGSTGKYRGVQGIAGEYERVRGVRGSPREYGVYGGVRGM